MTTLQDLYAEIEDLETQADAAADAGQHITAAYLAERAERLRGDLDRGAWAILGTVEP